MHLMQTPRHVPKEIGLPIPMCIMVNLKYGYGGRTIEAITKPINEPEIVPRTTLIGMNHLKQDNKIPTSVTLLLIANQTKQKQQQKATQLFLPLNHFL